MSGSPSSQVSRKPTSSAVPFPALLDHFSTGCDTTGETGTPGAPAAPDGGPTTGRSHPQETMQLAPRTVSARMKEKNLRGARERPPVTERWPLRQD